MKEVYKRRECPPRCPKSFRCDRKTKNRKTRRRCNPSLQNLPLIEPPIIPLDRIIVENWINPDIGIILSNYDPNTFEDLSRFIQDMNQDNTEIFDTDIIEFLKKYVSAVILRFGSGGLFQGVNQIADYAGAYTYNPSFFRGDIDFYLDKKPQLNQFQC
jgi:hypothetical protein